MTPTEPYPHRWFGFWELPGDPPGVYPKLEDWLRPDLAAGTDVGATVRYLLGGRYLWLRGLKMNCPVCGGLHRQPSHGRQTDGLWTWDNNIVPLVEHHGLVLPPGLRERVERFGGDPPPVEDSRLPRLSLPPRWSPTRFFGDPDPDEEE